MKRIRPILQSESSECGLATLAMICSYHGRNYDLPSARRQFPQSIKGANLLGLTANAQELGFSARALRIEIEELRQVGLPCIAHWNLNHFVVIERLQTNKVHIIDPALGRRKLSLTQVSEAFTGIVVELSPTTAFNPIGRAQRIGLRQITGRLVGLRTLLRRIGVVTLALELCAISMPFATQFAIDKILPSYDIELLKVVAYGLIALLTSQVLFSAARSWLILGLSQSIVQQWSNNVFHHLMRLPIGWFERRSLGDISSRFGVVEMLHQSLGGAFVAALVDGLMCIVALVIMLAYSPALAGISLGALAAFVGVKFYLLDAQRDATAERVILAAKESTYLLESIRAISPIKIFGRESYITSRRANLAVEVQNRDAEGERIGIISSSLNALIFGLENIAITVCGVAIIIQQSPTSERAFTVGMLFAFMAFKTQFQSRSNTFLGYLFNLWLLRINVERLADIVLTRPERPRTERGAAAVRDLSPSLEFRNVSFRHSYRESWILRHLNLKVLAGESVALIGASGSGKTTIVKLLLGILEPTSGEILIGGVPMAELGAANARTLMAAVMQDDYLLTGTIGENIAFFENEPDRVAMKEAARSACILEDIERMPMGMDTLVGDLGSGLSGGQKQRIILARALYSNPKILILDEATSHLDPENEEKVNSTLGARGMTRLIITHRPSSIDEADRVVEIKGGLAINSTSRATQ